MTNRRILVTVIVVTWNARELLQSCLSSLATQTMPRDEFQILVVDNASEDGTSAYLAEEHPDVTVITSPSNVGFAGGVAFGLQRVTSPYVVLLNNDAEADPGMLAAFIDAFARCSDEEHVGAITGKVLLADTGLINSTGNMVSRTGRGYDRDWRQPDDGRRQGGEVFGLCGAATAVRTAALADVGGIDPDLFLYYEDTDLSWRLRAAGWTVRYEPSAIARHRHAASSGAGSPAFHYWNERNSMIVFTRHAPAHLVLTMLARRVVGLVRHSMRDGLASELTRARWRAVAAYASRLPRTLRERNEIWRTARMSRAQVATLLTRSAG